MAQIEIYKTEPAITCILCGEDMSKLDKPVDTRCDFCGKMSPASYECAGSHYICDECYSMSAVEYVKSVCLKYKGSDPIELAVQIMNSPIIGISGGEHHFIVPAVMITCIHNAENGNENLIEKLDKAERRAIKEAPGVCTHSEGTCGAALGSGIFVSMYLNRDFQHDDAWSLSNHLVADILKKIANHGGPRCCKRDTYFALESAIDFMNDRFAFTLAKSEPKCTFSLRNKSCGHEQCDFYNMANSLV